MNFETRNPGFDRDDNTDYTDISLITDFTQVASCAIRVKHGDHQRRRVRAQLLRERNQRVKQNRHAGLIYKLFKLD